jgi:hypothetical protein
MNHKSSRTCGVQRKIRKEGNNGDEIKKNCGESWGWKMR